MIKIPRWTLDLMRNIHIDRLPVDIHPYYYHIYRTVYGLMADYAVTAYEKKLYTELTDKYRDSLLLVNKDNLLIHTLIQSDQYNVRNEYDKAIRLLTDYLALQKDYEHDVAICAYTLSESYRLKGDKEKEKEYLIVSAMADMKTAVREYISLRKLAVLLYQEGDIERAYSYVKICMEDAAACNARLRKLEGIKGIIWIGSISHFSNYAPTSQYSRRSSPSSDSRWYPYQRQ